MSKKSILQLLTLASERARKTTSDDNTNLCLLIAISENSNQIIFPAKKRRRREIRCSRFLVYFKSDLNFGGERNCRKSAAAIHKHNNIMGARAARMHIFKNKVHKFARVLPDNHSRSFQIYSFSPEPGSRAFVFHKLQTCEGMNVIRRKRRGSSKDKITIFRYS